MTGAVTYSTEQEIAKDMMINHAMNYIDGEHGNKVFTLCGYAGTGKTTVLRGVKEGLEAEGLNVVVGAYTGKAATVLIEKGIEAGTLHSILYDYHRATDKFYPKSKDVMSMVDVLIVDEASMVDTKILQTILSYDFPVLFIGDRFQLPPINGHTNLLDKVDMTLEKIHRQNKNSGIVNLSFKFRSETPITGEDLLSYPDVRLLERIPEDANTYDQILCGRNSTRITINQWYINQFHPDLAENYLAPGGKFIILNNTRYRGSLLSNGTIVESLPTSPIYGRQEVMDGYRDFDSFSLDVKCHNSPLRFKYDSMELPVYVDYLVDPWQEEQINVKTRRCFDAMKPVLPFVDYGYCTTVHKFQGSEADKVLLLAERHKRFGQNPQWMYTGVTRARKQLDIVIV